MLKNKDNESESKSNFTSIDDVNTNNVKGNAILRMNRRTFVKMAGITAGALALGNLRFIHPAYGSVQVPQTPLPGNNIPQFVDPMPHFAGLRINSSALTISMVSHSQQVLSTGTALAGGVVVGPATGLTGLWA